MKVTKAMKQCYVDAYDFIMEAADDSGISFHDFSAMGNRLCGMYDIMQAITLPTGDDIPEDIEEMQNTYEEALLKKMEG